VIHWPQRPPVINSFLAVGLVALVFPFQAKHSEGQLLSEGQYSHWISNSQGTYSWIPIDRWHMYVMSDGSYSVHAELAPFGKDGVHETRTLSSDLRLKGFSSSAHSVNISCDFNADNARCSLQVDESRVGSSASKEQRLPYNFMPFAGPFPFDIAWFYQAFVAQADRAPGRKATVPVLSLHDDVTNKGIELGIEETNQIEFLSREKIKILDREILADKFRIDDVERPNRENTNFVWVSQSGIILQIRGDSDDSSIRLTEYSGSTL
jgi:hypothetical protein